MSFRDLALQGIETAVNNLIDLDGHAADKLAPLHGHSVGIGLRGTGMVWYFVPDQQGHVQMLGSLEGEPDALIEGSPLDLMRASDKQQGTAQLFAGHVTLQGDTELAQAFSEALGSLRIDWEEQLSKLVGDVTAHEVGRAARELKQESERVGGIWQQNLSEYLTEEARLLPHPYEVEAWLSDVETLRDDVERLIARVDLIEPDRS
jgi:ubiquinone biosynthesis accessory factor UbiJ